MSTRTALSRHLAGQIITLIQEKGLRPGDRLPSVSELATQFSVAPGTMREVLGALQVGGILDIRHGAGTFVRADRDRLSLANAHHGGWDPGVVRDLLDARARVEPYLAELAAVRREDATLRRMEELLDAAELHMRDQDETHFHAGIGFHRALAAASGHTVLGPVIDSLLETRSGEQLVIHDAYPDPVRDHTEHLEILDAVRHRDGALAGGRMRAHIEQTSAAVKRWLDGGRPQADQLPADQLPDDQLQNGQDAQ